MKVKQKVSGQFKTPEGAQSYAVIRSVTDTCVKNGQNVLGAFKTIANLLPAIKNKTELAKKEAGGIMIWELGYDIPSGGKSLLSAINATAR